jgi:hypothetical protein
MLIRDKITYDSVTKKATIMRDGEYLYLAGELGMEGHDPYEPIRVYRPAEEVEKAYIRFNELKRLPITSDHPEEFLDLAVEDSFANGEALNPDLTKQDKVTVLDCVMNMKGKALDDYTAGTKELSCGWSGDFEPVTKEGLGYQFIQRFIDINHVALVSSGRCGRVCSVMDKKTVKDIQNKDAKREFYVILSNGLPTDGERFNNETEAKQRLKELEKQDPNNYKGYTLKKLVVSDSKNKDAKFIIRYKIKGSGMGSIDEQMTRKAIITANDEGQAKRFLEEEVGTKDIKYVEIIKDSKNKDGGNKMSKGKKKSISDELPMNNEQENVEKKDENGYEGGELEVSIDELVKLLVFAGLDEQTAQSKVSEFMQREDCNIGKRKDADVAEEKEDADVDADKEKEKEDADVSEEKEEVKDAAINDAFEKGRQAGRDEAVKRFSDVMPVIKSGEYRLTDLTGKTACEIKAMYVEKVLGEKVPLNDKSVLDKLFEVALKSKKMDAIEVTDNKSSLVKEIENITFIKEA